MKSRFTTVQHGTFNFVTRNGYMRLLNLIHQYRLLLKDTNLHIDNCLSVDSTLLSLPFFFLRGLLCSSYTNLFLPLLSSFLIAWVLLLFVCNHSTIDITLWVDHSPHLVTQPQILSIILIFLSQFLILQYHRIKTRCLVVIAPVFYAMLLRLLLIFLSSVVVLLLPLCRALPGFSFSKA